MSGLRIEYGPLVVASVTDDTMPQAPPWDHAAVRPVGTYHYERSSQAASATTPGTFRFGCDWLVTADTAAALAAAIGALEAATSRWDQPLRVQLDDAVWIAHDPTAGSGFALRPRLVKLGDAAVDGPRTRRLRFEVEGLLPAGAIGADADAGVVIHALRVEQAEPATNRPRITFQARATASASQSAATRLADPTTGLAAQVAAWLASFDPAGRYELRREERREDPAGRWLDATMIMEATPLPAGLGGAGWRVAQLSLDRRMGDFPADEPLVERAARYGVRAVVECDRAVVPAAGLADFARATVLPALLGHLQATWLSSTADAAGSLDPGALRTARQRLDVDAAGSRVVIELELTSAAGALVSLQVVQRMQHSWSVEPRKIWDGRPHTFALLAAGEQVRAEVTIEAQQLGAPYRVQPEAFAPAWFETFGERAEAASQPARWVLLARDDELRAVAAPPRALAGSWVVEETLWRTQTTLRFLLVADAGGAGSPIVPAAAVVIV